MKERNRMRPIRIIALLLIVALLTTFLSVNVSATSNEVPENEPMTTSETDEVMAGMPFTDVSEYEYYYDAVL